MKKIIPVIIALLLIAVVVLVSFGGKAYEKYSYGKELADLDEYYGVTDAAVGSEDGNLAVILQDEMVEEKAVVKSGVVYFGLDTVHKYLNEGFYADMAERKLLYTTAVDTVLSLFGEQGYSDRNGAHQTAYTVCYTEGDKLFIAADYIKLFTNFSYEKFDRHLQVYTEWGVKEICEVKKKTSLRVKGGIKSPILCELAKGDIVELLEEMDDWSKVKTADSVIGYVENKRLGNLSSEIETPVTDYVPEEYTSISVEGRLCLGWHSIGSVNGNKTLESRLEETRGLNVIAPTWFSLADDEGTFRSYASAEYVEKAHGEGLQVWGVWDNFNHRNETGEAVSTYQALSSTTTRQRMVQDMVTQALALGLDGINIDFEGLTEDIGIHFIQFLRELSVQCRQSGLVLSVDNPVPLNSNRFYRRDIQGQVADYVIIMGYDEHWHGSGSPGSVASIEFVSNGIENTVAQVPAGKVVNALPFYTILWKTEGSEVTDEYIRLNEVENFLKREDQEPVWDETTCQNYAEWQDGEITYQIWIEDEASLAVKLNVMRTQQIGGAAVWRIGYGTSAAWELVELYVNGQ